MAREHHCLECGAKLAHQAAEGLCPKCLMRAVIAGKRDSDATCEIVSVLEGPGMRIGRYELLELIGEGGMGMVYLAEQQEPVKRRVALKIIKPGMDSKEVIARFEAERQTLAILDHPNIAHVFDAGMTETGRPYFVMEHVRGLSITEYSDERRLSLEERLKLFKEVCEGVHHAHQKGIIHRDIKPSNILVSVHGDRAVPKIIDFGIAKAITQPLTDTTVFTCRGQLLGTPEYMSPEQVDLATADIDTRSDIYSLGVLLYELLAGVLPFDREAFKKAGFAEIQRTLQEKEPTPPSTRLTSLGEQAKEIAARRQTPLLTLARRLHRELEWIPMKAMRKDRTRRYRSASELADDIQNYLNGTPLIAGPESSVYRARKFVCKHAGSVATAAMVSVVVVLGLVVSILLSFRAEKARGAEAIARTQAEQAYAEAEQAREKEVVARKEVEDALVRAEKAEKLAREQAEEYRRLSYLHSVALADAKYREGNLRNARQLLRSCPEDLRNWEWHRLDYIMDESLITFGHEGEGAVALAFSPDGKWIATGFVAITIWNATTGEEIRTLKGHDAAVTFLAFTPDGRRIISASMDRMIKIWDVSSGRELAVLKGHEARKGIPDAALDEAGKRIVSIDYSGVIKVWDAADAKEILTIIATLEEGEYGRSVAISPDGKRIVAGRNSRRVEEWDASTGEKLKSFSAQDQPVFIVEYSPDGERIAMGCANGMIKIVDRQTEEETALAQGEGWTESLLNSLSFSPDGKQLVSGGYDRMVRVWDTQTGKEVTALTGHPASITRVEFSPDGRYIASAAFGGRSRVWDPSEEREGRVLGGGHTSSVRAVVFSPDGKKLISAGMDASIKIWDISRGVAIHTCSGHKASIWSLAISPNGRQIVSGSDDHTIRIWDIDGGEEVKKLPGHEGAVFAVIFSPDGKQIISGGADNKTRIWDVSTGEELKILTGHGGPVTAVACSPDGREIVSGSSVIRIWNTATGEELRTLSGHVATVRAISFTPDGKRIISGGYDATVRIWDAATGDKPMTLLGHNRNVEAVAVSPDGRRIVSGSFLTTKVWDVDTGTELMNLPSKGSLAVAFSPDGKTIAGTSDKDIMLWQSDLRSDQGNGD